MELDEYQKKALVTAVYERPHEGVPVYTALGLCGEAGEVAEKIKRYFRGEALDAGQVAKELGDVLWYVACLANDIGFTLQQVADMNIEKLRLRQEKNLLLGSGDDRGLDLYEQAEEIAPESDELGW